MNCPICDKAATTLPQNLLVCPSDHVFLLNQFGESPLWQKEGTLVHRLAVIIRRFCVEHDRIEQILGRAMGYPELGLACGEPYSHQVCIGEHVATTLASEAAEMIRDLQVERDEYQKAFMASL